MNEINIHSHFGLEKLDLGIQKITFNPRDSKKGRFWIPFFNGDNNTLPNGFTPRMVYLSDFLVPNNTSGNHYHRVKEEILIPVHGDFEFIFEDVQSKARFILNCKHTDHIGIYVPTGISHKITSKEETGKLLVLASEPSDLSDEIEYAV